MHKSNGTPATMTLEQERVDRLARLSPKRTVPTAALLRAYAEIDALRDAAHALTAKAAALDALVEAAMVLVAHAQEAYPHFEYTRGQADIAATLAALSAAKAAQVSK